MCRATGSGATVGLHEQPTDVSHLWRNDLVTFVIGCSFSFEQALMQAPAPLRHVQQGKNVAMYRTDLPTVPAARSAGRWWSRCGP